jgi:hypothetical protein
MDARALVAARAYFSWQHLSAAALCARSAKSIETSKAGTKAYFPEHRSYVIGSVLFSVAALEAAINELFADASEANLGKLRPVDENVIKRMGEMWLLGVPRTARYTVAEKYAIALALDGKPPFHKGTEPWQSVAKLLKLRNALIHYEPEWVPVDSTKEPGDEHTFEKQLSGKFPVNPLAPTENPFYPDKVLGHGCAAWAVRSAMDFMDSFQEKLGLLAGLYGGKNDPEFVVE